MFIVHAKIVLSENINIVWFNKQPCVSNKPLLD
jgi:hypothetical protein